MDNALVLLEAPFFGFMPGDLRTWLQTHSDDASLAAAFAAVCNRTGTLLHEFDEAPDPWLDYVFDAWYELQKELLDLIFASMRQANLCGKANYQLEPRGVYPTLEPFMEKNGYESCSGWWRPIKEDSITAFSAQL